MKLQLHIMFKKILFLFTAIGVMLTSISGAFSSEGPKLIPGKPLRYSLNSCLTNTFNAVSCIESIKIISVADGKVFATGTPTGHYFPAGTDIAGNDGVSRSNNSGFVAGVDEEWEFKGLTFPTGKDLAIPRLQMQPSGATWCWFAGQCDSHREELSINILPEPTSSAPPQPIHFLDFPSDKQCGPKENPFLCTMPLDFQQSYEFQFVIRVPQAFKFGEASGRGTKYLTVKESPSATNFDGVATKDLTVDFQNMNMSSVLTSELIPNPYIQGPHAHYESNNPNVWIYGQDNSIVAFLGTCGSIGGLVVGSNAMTADSPAWDSKSESMSFRLEAPHLKTSGELNDGYVELRINQAMATCLWALNLADTVSASISASYSDGTAPTLITTVGRKVGNEFVIATAGFHYSAPKLAIKLQNMAPEATPSPIASPTPTLSVSASPTIQVTASSKVIAAKSTITCIKGKVRQKISGLNPTCPKGFKKV